MQGERFLQRIYMGNGLNVFLFVPEREQKMKLRDTLTRATWYGHLSTMANYTRIHTITYTGLDSLKK